MDTGTPQWPQFQEIRIGSVVKQMESSRPSSSIERRSRDEGKDEGLKCPRCNSSNTKFCYYNNYSLSQPRYFCKTCRRYWTQGGSLRNVPVGGGSRKNKRSLSSSSSVSSKKLVINPPHLSPQVGFFHYQNPNINHKIYHSQDLNLAYPPPLPPQPSSSSEVNGSKTHFLNPNSFSSMNKLLKTGMSSRGMILGSFTPLQPYLLSDSNISMYSSSSSSTTGLCSTLQEFKPTINFCLKAIETTSEYENDNVHKESTNTGARLLFPSDDLKQVPTNTTTTSTTPATEFNDHHRQQNREQGGNDTTGFWNGILGGGEESSCLN